MTAPDGAGGGLRGHVRGARYEMAMLAAGLTQREAVRCNTSLQIAKRSMCPSGHWQDRTAQLLVEESRRTPAAHNLTMVNVGANKVRAARREARVRARLTRRLPPPW